jgi:choline dehydrogenase-like flavoprotein
MLGPRSQTVGNSCGLIPLQLCTDNYTQIIQAYEAQNFSQYLPSSYTASQIAGYGAQRKVLAKSFASDKAAVLEVPFNGASSGAMVLMKPASRGTVLMNSTNKYAEPTVYYGMLTNPTDTEVMIANIRFVRKWMNTTAMQTTFAPSEIAPGASLLSDADLAAWVATNLSPTTAHGCCTAAMLPEELGGVVSPELLVHGVTGLSVGDISMMPLIPATHTCSSVYAIAEKVRFLIAFTGCVSNESRFRRPI